MIFLNASSLELFEVQLLELLGYLLHKAKGAPLVASEPASPNRVTEKMPLEVNMERNMNGKECWDESVPILIFLAHRVYRYCSRLLLKENCTFHESADAVENNLSHRRRPFR